VRQWEVVEDGWRSAVGRQGATEVRKGVRDVTVGYVGRKGWRQMGGAAFRLEGVGRVGSGVGRTWCGNVAGSTGVLGRLQEAVRETARW
jgi:hypothetical protein